MGSHCRWAAWVGGAPQLPKVLGCLWGLETHKQVLLLCSPCHPSPADLRGLESSIKGSYLESWAWLALGLKSDSSLLGVQLVFLIGGTRHRYLGSAAAGTRTQRIWRVSNPRFLEAPGSFRDVGFPSAGQMLSLE